MGTNYYIRKAIRPSKLQELKDLVTEENIYNGKLQEALSEFNEIHIGKSSCGWQFCFNHNNWKYFGKSRKEIEDFIQSSIDEGGKFVDEYGDEITPTNFWKLVDSKKKGWDLNSYYMHEQQEYDKYLIHPELYKDEIFKPSYPYYNYWKDYPETFVDGLRFSYNTDFC